MVDILLGESKTLPSTVSVLCWLINAARCVFVCVPAVFQVWRGIGAGGGWSQGWTRCLPWDSDGRKAEVRIFNYPVWLVRYRGGRARLGEVYQKGRGAIRLPTNMLSIRLPQLLDTDQVPKVRLMLGSSPSGSCSQLLGFRWQKSTREIWLFTDCM